MIIRVLTDQFLFTIADYEADWSVNIGDVVSIPLRNKMVLGIVKEIILSSKFTLKPAIFLNLNCKKFLDFFLLVSLYSNIPTNYFVKMIKIAKRIKYKIMEVYIKPVDLNEEQLAAREIIEKSKNTLLWGITGSGKTEVFFSLLNKDYQTLILTPEIVLAKAMAERIKNFFGMYPLIWTSESNNLTNYYTESNVIVGTRSALFLNFKNLKYIIVDEEHDASYKQNKNPFYHARDMALVLGQVWNAKVILASATPSLESFYNMQQNKLSLAKITKRYNKSQLKISVISTISVLDPKTKIICLRELKKGNQILFFLNRRGYATFVLCSYCNTRQICSCGGALIFHKKKDFESSVNKLMCHYCLKFAKFMCIKCEKSTFVFCGMGVHKLQELLQKEEGFESYSIGVLSSDEDNLEEIMEKIRTKTYNIIIGTQIMAKGHNFPLISLVVILGMGGGMDFRFNEQIFQNLVQVAGRAGRGDQKSEVIIQSLQENKLLEFVKNQDVEGFLSYELEERKKWNLPPFIKIITIYIKNYIILNRVLKEIKDLGEIYGPFYVKKTFIIHLKTHHMIKVLNILKNYQIIVDTTPLSLTLMSDNVISDVEKL